MQLATFPFANSLHDRPLGEEEAFCTDRNLLDAPRSQRETLATAEQVQLVELLKEGRRCAAAGRQNSVNESLVCSPAERSQTAHAESEGL